MYCRIGSYATVASVTALASMLNGIVAQPLAVAEPDEVAQRGELLFRSGFEGEVRIGALHGFGDGAWQEITGEDAESGFAWPPSIWGGTAAFQLIAGDEPAIGAAEIAARMSNTLEFVTGPHGNRTRVLRQVVHGGTGGVDENWGRTQNDLVLFPGPDNQGDLYVAYWLKLQGDLFERLTAGPGDRDAPTSNPALPVRPTEHATDNPWAARVLSDWKTGIGAQGGDYRILLSIHGDRDAHRLWWHIKGDNVANGGLPEQIFWEQTNTIVEVPVGQWFRLEVFVHRSHGTDGRVRVAADGATVFDRYGPNFGIHSLPWNRIMPFLNYSTGQRLPAEQWVDDLEIRSGLPPDATTAAAPRDGLP